MKILSHTLFLRYFSVNFKASPFFKYKSEFGYWIILKYYYYAGGGVIIGSKKLLRP